MTESCIPDDVEEQVKQHYGERTDDLPELDAYTADILEALDEHDGKALFGALRKHLDWTPNKFKHHYRTKLKETLYINQQLVEVEGREERLFELTDYGRVAVRMYKAHNNKEIKPAEKKNKILNQSEWMESKKDRQDFREHQQDAEVLLWVLHEWFIHLNDEETWETVVKGARQQLDYNDGELPPLPGLGDQ